MGGHFRAPALLGLSATGVGSKHRQRWTSWGERKVGEQKIDVAI